MTERTSRYLPAIDGLRGVAVIVVVAYHLGLLRGGFLGVDLFFVLSGFLITRLLIDEDRRTGRIDLVAFWRRRARRLLPAFVVLFIAVGVWLLVTPSSDVPSGIGSQALAAATWTSNWQQIYGGGGYWAAFGSPSPLRHLWSLAIEEQFYVVHPVVVIGVLALTRRRPWRMALAFGGLGVASAAWAVHLVAAVTPVDRVYLGTDTRVAALCAGAALAAVLAEPRRGSRRLTSAVGALTAPAVLVIVIAWAQLSFVDLTTTKWLVLLATEIAALVVVAACALVPSGRLTAPLRWGPLRRVGRISYSLYLFHWPIHVWLSDEWPTQNVWVHRVLVVVASVVAAELVTRCVEAPIRANASLVRPGSANTIGAACIVVVLVLAAMFVRGSRGVPGQLAHAEPVLNAIEAPVLRPVSVPSDERGGTERVLVLGDSVAALLTDAMGRSATEAGIRADTRAAVACGLPDPGTKVLMQDRQPVELTDRCRDWLANWPGYLDQFRPDSVVIIHSVVYFGFAQIDGEWRGPCTPEYRRWYTGLVLDEIDLVSTPTADGHRARAVIATMADNRAKMLADLDPAVLEARDREADCVNDAVRDAVAQRPSTARLLDLAEWVCPDGDCVVDVDGEELRPDGLHFEGHGADVAAQWIVDEIRSP